VDDVRQALGYDHWNLFGVSYGTRLALRVMHDFPAGVRSVILDSTYPPGASLADAPVDAGRAIRDVLQACRADAACGGAYGDIEQRLYRTIDKYNANPAQFRVFDPDRGRPVTRAFTGDDFVDELFTAMYRTSAIPNVPAAVAAADNGSMLDGLRMLYGDLLDREKSSNDPNDSGDRPGLSDGLYLTVECREDFPFTDWETAKAHAGELNPSLAGALLKTTEQTFHRCSIWPHDDTEQNPTTDGDIPTLVLAGSFDPITPAAWGQLAASTLPKSTFMLFNGAGHGTFVAGDCPMAKIKTFVGDPASGGGPPCDLPPVRWRT
jgi:pimeloyl-ACP methyl ester carboxylesterase